MNGFHVTFAEVLRDSWGALVFGVIGLILFIVAILVWRVAKGQLRGVMTIVTVSVGVTMLALTLSIPFSVTGAGWSIGVPTGKSDTAGQSAAGQSSAGQSSAAAQSGAGGGILSAIARNPAQAQLMLKTGFGTVTWPLVGIQAKFVTDNSAYTPVVRTGGYGGTQLQTGKFRLANGDNVLMFRYGNHPKLLLTYVGARAGAAGSPQPQLLISSPNVDVLFSAIISANKGEPMPPRIEPAHIQTSGGQLAKILIAIVITLVAIGAQIWMSVRYAPRLPATVASHWNVRGEVDGHAPKRVILWIGPVIATLFGAISILVVITPATTVIVIPFWVMQALMIYITWWMFQRNLDTNAEEQPK